MTTKKIKTSDILGENYYTYELTSSNYTPTLNGSITITCTMKDVYGTVANGKSITLYQNGTSKGTQTTNSSGVATWSITCSTAGLQKFSIKDTSIEVFVDNKEDTSNKLTSLQSLNDLSTDTQYPSAKLVYTYWSDLNDTLQNDYPLSNSLGAVAFSNAYEDLDGLPSLGNLAFENDVDLSGHDLDELSDNTNLLFSGDYNDLDNKPTIPTATSDLINDSGFLTSHQSLDSKTVTVEKLATATSGYLSSYVVKQNGVQVGNTINIPKDFLVKSGSVKTVSTANSPVSGYSVGDKYIDLVINVQEGTSTDSHIYILVSDLVDTPVAISDVTGLQSALNDFELVALKTDDISQLTSDTEYYPSAKGVADYVDYIIPLTNLSDFNDDLDYLVDVSMDNVNSGISINQMQTSGISYYANANNEITQSLFNRAILEEVGSIETELSNRIRTSYIADNLTTNDATKVLSAKQGKVLNDTKANKSQVVDWDNIVFVDKADDTTGSIILNFLT